MHFITSVDLCLIPLKIVTLMSILPTLWHMNINCKFKFICFFKSPFNLVLWAPYYFFSILLYILNILVIVLLNFFIIKSYAILFYCLIFNYILHIIMNIQILTSNFLSVVLGHVALKTIINIIFK